ncbi:MAG: type II toxin-antitoxin system prevent-host-death family antitoxin [Deltaproteobacteria bacterium]|nr:type II toxin-antitoxin system prevent-host-death family antitoxin [Deltaproteobacteria bacterium]
MNEVKIGKLRNRLSYYLKKVRKGAEITIMDRDTPIGRIVPYASAHKDDELKMIPPPNGYAGLAKLSFPDAKISIDPVDILLEDRRKR